MKRLFAGLGLACILAAPALADDLAVVKDQSKVIKLTAQASTIVVGNPSIADVAMQDGMTAVLTGKGYGTTNVIAMDADGRQIASFRISVTSETARAVTLMRGNQQVSLSCAPRCQAVETSGGSAAPAAAPTN